MHTAMPLSPKVPPIKPGAPASDLSSKNSAHHETSSKLSAHHEASRKLSAHHDSSSKSSADHHHYKSSPDDDVNTGKEPTDAASEDTKEKVADPKDSAPPDNDGPVLVQPQMVVIAPPPVFLPCAVSPSPSFTPLNLPMYFKVDSDSMAQKDGVPLIVPQVFYDPECCTGDVRVDSDSRAFENKLGHCKDFRSTDVPQEKIYLKVDFQGFFSELCSRCNHIKRLF